jgi:ketosteroid isomerase-like protein
MEAIMTQDFACERDKPTKPADLARLFLDRANAGDVDGAVAVHETGALLAFPSGKTAVGTKAIREVYETFLAHRRTVTSEGQSAPLVKGDIALTVVAPS